MGVWIETKSESLQIGLLRVTPRVGVWIETYVVLWNVTVVIRFIYNIDGDYTLTERAKHVITIKDIPGQ